MNITPLELSILNAVNCSEYGDSFQDPIWFHSIEHAVDKAQISGVISSLVKKDLAGTQDEGTPEHTIWLTDKGVDVFLSCAKEHDLELYKGDER